MMIPTAGLAMASNTSGEGLGQHIIQYAKQLLAELILPQKITNYEVERYYRKAHRTGIWRKLKPEAKALLYVVKRTIRLVKSLQLISILKNIFLQIELGTIRAKALFYGIMIYTQLSKIHSLKDLKRKMNWLLATGINCLNNPLMYIGFI